MRLLLALALAMGGLAAPAAARENPAGDVRADDRFRVGSITSCGEFWGHNGEVPGYLAHAYTDTAAARPSCS
jgi:hypothetical protein